MVDFDGRAWDEPAGQWARGWRALDRLYRASDRWFYLAAPRPEDAERVRTVTGTTRLQDAALEGLFAAAPAEEWVRRFGEAGVAAHVHVSHEELFEDERSKQRGLSIIREHPGVGSVRAPGPGPRLSRTRVAPARPAAAAGADAAEILESLDLRDRMDELIAAGAIAERQPDRPLGAGAAPGPDKTP